MSPAVELTAYRVVQEALANVVRHSGPGTAVQVTLDSGAERLLVRVVDDGQGAGAATADLGGHGLLGMRERVTLMGGELHAGPTAEGGFAICAELPTGTSSMIRVLLADDQELVREGLRMMLNAQDDIEVIGEASTGHEVLALCRDTDPDLVVMDIRMPGMDGIEATQRLVTSGSRAAVLVLTTFDLDEYVYRALRAGASGFLLKDGTSQQLATAVRTVAAGDTLLAPAITRRLIADYVSRPRPPDQGGPPWELTDRELAVVRQLAQGKSNAEIASSLFLSEATVKSHIAHTLAKLDLRDRVQIVIYAFEHGLTHHTDTSR